MAQFQRGDTFVDGQTVTAARLNNLVDLATAINGFILDHTSSPVSPNDQIVMWDDATNSLKKATLAVLLTDVIGVTSVALTMPSPTFAVTGTPITSSGTLGVSWDAQSANTVLAGPPSGSTGTPGFRALNASDLTVPTVTIAATTINWDLGNVFTKTLGSGTTTFGFANANEGQTIRVLLANDGAASHVVNWSPTIRWPGGVDPVQTPGPGRNDIYTFHFIGGLFYGTFAQDFLL